MADTHSNQGLRAHLAPYHLEFLPLWSKPWTLEASLRFCHTLATSHYENFPVALHWFRQDQQDALAAVYAFSRLADDFADEPPFKPLRVELLQAWREQLTAISEDQQPKHPVFIALKDAVRRFRLDTQLLDDLLSAFLQDCEKQSYDTMTEVEDYCRRSANPVGRLVLQILGQDNERHNEWSDAICTALQLTNFWQDLSVDLPRGRRYIPTDLLHEHGLSQDDLLSGDHPQRLAALIDTLVNDTRKRFRQGKPLVFSVNTPANLYLAGVYLGGRTVLRMVRDLGAEALHTRPSLGKRTVTRAWWNAGIDRLFDPKELRSWMH